MGLANLRFVVSFVRFSFHASDLLPSVPLSPSYLLFLRFSGAIAAAPQAFARRPRYSRFLAYCSFRPLRRTGCRAQSGLLRSRLTRLLALKLFAPANALVFRTHVMSPYRWNPYPRRCQTGTAGFSEAPSRHKQNSRPGVSEAAGSCAPSKNQLAVSASGLKRPTANSTKLSVAC